MIDLRSLVVSVAVAAMTTGCSHHSASGASDADGSTGSTSSALSSKRGIAYGFSSAADLEASMPGIGWWYDWASQPNSGVQSVSGVEFAPMVWGGTFDVPTIESQIPAGAKSLLGFNEPNFGSQSNLTPQQAAALWPQVEQIAKDRGLELVSPALNYCGGTCNETNPFDWLQAFFAACDGCKVDAIALHWYACTGDALNSYLSDYKARFTQPLWLTEFSCLDDSSIDAAKESGYMTDALAILDADPIVARYAWFTGRSDSTPIVNLFGADGQLTELGKQYVGVK